MLIHEALSDEDAHTIQQNAYNPRAHAECLTSDT